MEDLIHIARELGLPALVVLVACWFVFKAGSAAYEGVAWMGPNFLIPIRDGIVGHFSVLTQFIVEIRKTLPLVTQSHEKVIETLNRQEEMISDAAKDQAKTRATFRATVRVLSNQCPVAEGCPFKQKDVLDSDLKEVEELEDKRKKRSQPQQHG